MNFSSNVTGRVNEPSGVSLTLLLITGFLGLIALVGFLGNILVILVIKRLRSYGVRSSAHIFIFHLALSDLLVCCMCIPLTISVNFIRLQVNSMTSKAICKCVRFLQFLAPTISISILTTIAIDRFFALVQPLNQSAIVRRPKWMITIAWIFSFALFVPSIFLVDVIEMRVGALTFGYCTTVPNNTTFGLIFLLVIGILSFVAPLVAITFMYAKIVRVVWFRHEGMQRGELVGREATFKKSRIKVLKMFIIVIVVFVACWLPFVIYCGFVEMHVASFPNPGDMIRIVTYCLGLSNSSCNPFVYFFSVDWLRKACRDLICCRESQEVLRMSSKMSSSPLVNRRIQLHPKPSSSEARSGDCVNGTVLHSTSVRESVANNEHKREKAELLVCEMLTSL